MQWATSLTKTQNVVQVASKLPELQGRSQRREKISKGKQSQNFQQLGFVTTRSSLNLVVFQNNLYTLYPNLPERKGLAFNWKEPGEHYSQNLMGKGARAHLLETWREEDMRLPENLLIIDATGTTLDHKLTPSGIQWLGSSWGGRNGGSGGLRWNCWGEVWFGLWVGLGCSWVTMLVFVWRPVTVIAGRIATRRTTSLRETKQVAAWRRVTDEK